MAGFPAVPCVLTAAGVPIVAGFPAGPCVLTAAGVPTVAGFPVLAGLQPLVNVCPLFAIMSVCDE